MYYRESMRVTLDASVIADYARDGAVVVRGAFTPDEVALVTEGIEANLASPGPLVAVASDPDDPVAFQFDFQPAQCGADAAE